VIPVVTADQMRSIEELAFKSGETVESLSQRAAESIADEILRLIREELLRPPVAVVAGPGNNGLDAIKTANILANSGISVKVFSWKRQESNSQQAELEDVLDESRTILDGIFGIGLSRNVEGEAAQIIERLNSFRSETDARTVSIDIPSGLHSDNGKVMGVSIVADYTVTLGYPKSGLYTGKGPESAGVIVHKPLGFTIPEDFSPLAWGFTQNEYEVKFPERKVGSHKNDNGRLIVLGGSLKYPGAPVLAARAAARAGAGYVTVAFPRSLYYTITSHLNQETVWPLPEAEPFTLGPASVEEAREAASTYKALVVGNGVGREEATIDFVLELLGLPGPEQRRAIGFRPSPNLPKKNDKHQIPPTVVDGDGLFALASQDSWWVSTPQVQILTPHPGEMARLVNKSVSEVESDRFGISVSSSKEWGKVVLLKGAYPLIAKPDGEVYLLIESHPEVSSAGTGDVLAGLCGFFLSLGYPAADAAQAALVLGSRAASIASETVSKNCVGATDLIDALPAARMSL